jgi:phage repressor protein C with HTH and peptisase S24 domain
MNYKIREIIRLHKIRQEDFVEKLGTSVQQLRRLDEGERRMTMEWLEKIDATLRSFGIKDFKKNALISGNVDFSYDNKEAPSYGLGDSGRGGYVTKIPVWGTVDAQDGEKYAVNTEDTPITWIEPLPAQHGDKDAFCLLVAGESMLPKYEPGYIVCVNTRKPAIKGRDCVVEMLDGHAFLKKFITADKDFYHLEQLNPQKSLKIEKKLVKRVLPVVGAVYD